MLQHLLQVFWSVSDQVGTLCTKGFGFSDWRDKNSNLQIFKVNNQNGGQMRLAATLFEPFVLWEGTHFLWVNCYRKGKKGKQNTASLNVNFLYLNQEYLCFDLITNFMILLVLISINDESKHSTIMCCLQNIGLSCERVQVLTTKYDLLMTLLSILLQ